jgi:hypothetical protein
VYVNCVHVVGSVYLFVCVFVLQTGLGLVGMLSIPSTLGQAVFLLARFIKIEL